MKLSYCRPLSLGQDIAQAQSGHSSFENLCHLRGIARTGGLLIHRSYLCVEVKCRREILGFTIFWILTKYVEYGRTAEGTRYSEGILRNMKGPSEERAGCYLDFNPSPVLWIKSQGVSTARKLDLLAGWAGHPTSKVSACSMQRGEERETLAEKM